MPVFMELTTSPGDLLDRAMEGAETASFTKKGGWVARRAGLPSVRRPLRGLEIKDETYAVLRVMDFNGNFLPLYDSGQASGRTINYTNFSLQSVQEAKPEKYQIVETFGDPYIFLFGAAPRMLNCVALLVNSLDFNWKNEFWENYEDNFRGTKCAERGARVYLLYDDNVVEGYMLNATAQDDAHNPMAVMMQFQLFVTGHQNISWVGIPEYPMHSDSCVSTIEGIWGEKTIGNLSSADKPASAWVNKVLGGANDIIAKVEGAIDTVNKATDLTQYSWWPFGRTAITRSKPDRSLIWDNADEWTTNWRSPPLNSEGVVPQVTVPIAAALATVSPAGAGMLSADAGASTGMNNIDQGTGTMRPQPPMYDYTAPPGSAVDTSGDYPQPVPRSPVSSGAASTPSVPSNTGTATSSVIRPAPAAYPSPL